MKDRMTWEETIISIRKEEGFKDLVEKAYFDEDLELNVTVLQAAKNLRKRLF